MPNEHTAALSARAVAGHPDAQKSLSKFLSSEKYCLIIASQDCDIVAADSLERYVEFVAAKKCKGNAPHANNCHGRSSRYLEFQLEGQWFKAEAQKTVYVEKKCLLGVLAETRVRPVSLPEVDKETFIRWKANRYLRQPLPNQFIRMVAPQMLSLIEEGGLENCGALYLSLEPFEESDEYRLRLCGLHKRGASQETFAPLYDRVEEILEELNALDGITCPYIEGDDSPAYETIMPAMRRHEFTIGQRDKFVRWNFDHVSLENGEARIIEE